MKVRKKNRNNDTSFSSQALLVKYNLDSSITNANDCLSCHFSKYLRRILWERIWRFFLGNEIYDGQIVVKEVEEFSKWGERLDPKNAHIVLLKSSYLNYRNYWRFPKRLSWIKSTKILFSKIAELCVWLNLGLFLAKKSFSSAIFESFYIKYK